MRKKTKIEKCARQSEGNNYVKITQSQVKRGRAKVKSKETCA